MLSQLKCTGCIHRIFEQQAADKPGAVALRQGGREWTYQDLNERANGIAWALQALGVGRESIVALDLDRSLEMVAAILGVLKAGGAYAPLDRNDPPARRETLLADLNACVVLDEAKLANLGGDSSENPDLPAAPTDLAYVMFTSGSTGAPKGVMIEHRSVVRLVRDTDYVRIDAGDVFLQLAPLPFDASTFEIWGPLLNGAALAIMPPGLASLGDIANAIRQYGVTTLWLTSGLFHAMVDQQLESLAGLKQLLAGGDVLSPSHVRRFLDAGSDCKLINGYGPTEGTTFTCCYRVPRGHPANAPVPIGVPIAHTTVYLLNERFEPVPDGMTGELYAGGEGVARGYLRQPELTVERFLPDPFSKIAGARMYRTGDLARRREDGVIEFLGRVDGQLKMRGFRIETGEIETALNLHESVSQSVVVARDAASGEKRLIAYLVTTEGFRFDVAALRELLRNKLPDYMHPAEFVAIGALPLTPNGKVDRRALGTLGSNARQVITETWEEVLAISQPNIDTAFFDLGGSSLQLLRVQGLLEQRLQAQLTITDLFRYPTIRSLAEHCNAGDRPVQSEGKSSTRSHDIAIIGMAARLPGASDVRQFWENLKNGVESITFFGDEELEAGGGPNSIKARPILDDVEMFDAAFFGILPKEAETMDPQHRVFLECSVEALDDAGCDPSRYKGDIGVFAGCSPNTYFLRHLCGDREFIEDYTGDYQVGNYQTMLGSSPDFLATRVSYKLNLTGPSMMIGTACSTSLVAVAQACDSLVSGQCGMALAGGVSITLPQKRGYQYQEGGIASADGHCRAFDADAQGTVFGSGCGVVVLKRLEDAVAHRDSIYAVIKGYSINNDGAGKMGFTAPGIEGQAKVIQRAQEMAGISPETVTFVEAHGTGTPLGDPIEIAALTQAFRVGTNATQFCAVGTAKTNVGHLDAAAGVTGLIKAALSVKHGVLPATLHYRKPNPRIDFASTPFYVNSKLTDWRPVGFPRRAGVSAFGVGGTNAHIILEESPVVEAKASHEQDHLLLLSAKSPASLDESALRLDAYLKRHPETDLADAAWTLVSGRRRFEYRRMIVSGASTSQRVEKELPVVFAFPGQGAQHPGMGRGLYRSLPVFRACVDQCAEILRPRLGFDIRESIDADRLNQTAVAQPSIFALEFALAQQWMNWGIKPAAMLGHSVGEFVAATLAGVFSLEDALALVAARGRLMQELPGGKMLSVRMPEQDLLPYLNGHLSIAAVNSPSLCVASGPSDAVDVLDRELSARNIVSRTLRTSHAFHSAMVQPILAPLNEMIQKVQLNAPKIPFVSTLTGEWITAEQATSPDYWTRHCRETVQFSKAVRRLQRDRSWCVLETGPGQALSTLVRQHGSSPNPLTAIASLPDAASSQTENAAMLAAAGRLWLCGIEPNWLRILNGEGRRLISLPAYAFDRKRYWVDPPKKTTAALLRKETMTAGTPDNSPARKDRLRAELITLFEDLSGMDLQAVSAGVSFLELGFDSLFLTQATQSIASKYGAKIRFAQLLDELSTLEQLSAYLDSALPAEVVAVSSPIATVAASPQHAAGIEQLMRDQLQAFADLTARQLEACKSSPAPAALRIEAPKIQLPKFESFGPFKPIQKDPASGLSANQSAYLESFIDRYTSRTKESKRLTQLHRGRLADPRVASGFRQQWKELVYPIMIERSRGSKLWDVDGNEYVDILNGFGVTMFGHAPDFVRAAVAEQLERGIEIGPQTPQAGKVADLLCELTGMERATFCNTGSEAVMAAMRLARTVTGKNKIVFFTGDYHGAFDEVLVKAAGRPGGPPRSRPIAPGIPDEKAANVLVLEYGSPASLEIIRAHAHELAAVMVEPIQSRHPNLRPVEFLRELRSITEQSNTALIFDEVVTGFRTHPGGAQALFGIQADLATYGKVIGGGLPIGALAGKAKFMDALDGGWWQYGDESSPEVGVTFFAGTFVRHPLAMAACWAVLNHIKTAGPRLQDSLSDKTGQLVNTLNELFERGSVPARIESFRSIFYFGFPPGERLASLLYYHLREKGVHIQEGFPCFLTTAHTEQDLARVVGAFRDSIADMQAGGFLPQPVAEPVAEPLECEAPLTEAQMEIRLSAQMGEEESCSYNEGFTIRLRGELDEDALREALETVVNRHEALRATLTSGGDGLRILAKLAMPLPKLDLSEVPETALASRIQQLKIADACLPFDLVQGPLVRAKLVRLSASDHVLFITAHHVVCDGWSVNIILDELSKLYTARRKGATASLSVPMRFSEYARKQAAESVDPAVEAYWVSEYAEPAPPLELPLDRPRPALKSYAGSTFITSIDASEYQAIKKAGAQRGSTLFSTLLSAFQALLSRLTGQSDIVVGIPSAAQSALADETLVGHCVNFLPIRVKLNSDASFKDLLAQTKRKVIEAYEHQSYTYGTLVRKLAIPRNPSRLPLIEVQFNLERVGASLKFDGLQAEVDQNPKRFVNFDIFLNMVESTEGLKLYCDYNTALFDEATIARWLRHYRSLLLGFVEDANRAVSSLPLMGEAERRALLSGWNQTGRAYPDKLCVHQNIEEQAARTPDTIAVRFEDKRLTYADLDRKASLLASWLKSQGVAPGTLVGISIEPSLEMPIAVLGVMKSGAAYVPLDPNYPAERLNFIEQDAGLKLLLTSNNWPNLDVVQPAPLPAVQSSDLAYVIYTSGSTGKPKGVEISHRAVMNFLWAMRWEPGLSPDDKLLAVTTLSFDIAGLELFLPLTTGAELVIAPRDAARDGKELASLIHSAGITIMQATPTTWKLLIEAGWAGSPNLKILCGGEELTRDLANELLSRGASLWNMYGPTETTIWSTIWKVQPGEGPVLIGKPIANTRVYVLDARRQPTAIGVPGELYIAGDGLARGYLNAPDLTAEKFPVDPSSCLGESRMYRTGDLARYLPDGNLVCHGRLDNQVKIRGHRIELGEIESALLAHPSIQDGAVIVREDRPGEKRLAAYLIPRRKEHVSPAALRAALAERLPDYMVPALFCSLESLPLTPNGKIDRRALAQLPPPSFTPSDHYAAPSTEHEKAIALVWQEVLQVARVGADDDLFSLGADSIHLFQISSRAAREGLSVTPKQLLQHRTIRAIANSMRLELGQPRKALSSITAVSRESFRIKRTM